jgi:hypothetical protein
MKIANVRMYLREDVKNEYKRKIAQFHKSIKTPSICYSSK